MNHVVFGLKMYNSLLEYLDLIRQYKGSSIQFFIFNPHMEFCELNR